jgi:hypothetical protein
MQSISTINVTSFVWCSTSLYLEYNSSGGRVPGQKRMGELHHFGLLVESQERIVLGSGRSKARNKYRRNTLSVRIAWFEGSYRMVRVAAIAFALQDIPRATNS